MPARPSPSRSTAAHRAAPRIAAKRPIRSREGQNHRVIQATQADGLQPVSRSLPPIQRARTGDRPRRATRSSAMVAAKQVWAMRPRDHPSASAHPPQIQRIAGAQSSSAKPLTARAKTKRPKASRPNPDRPMPNRQSILPRSLGRVDRLRVCLGLRRVPPRAYQGRPRQRPTSGASHSLRRDHPRLGLKPNPVER